MRKEFKNLDQLLKLSGQSSDFKTTVISLGKQEVSIFYYSTLIDAKWMQQHLILVLQNRALDSEIKDIEDIKAWIPINDIEITDELTTIQSKLLKGYAIVQLHENDQKCALVNLADNHGMRKTNETENEFSVVGPKVGFIEDLDTNIGLLRKQINLPNLIIKEIIVGKTSKTKVAIIYIDGLTNEQTIQTVEQRLTDIDYDVVFDSSTLDQIMSDNSWTPFPLFVSSERRERVVYSISIGQVAVLSDGSPYCVTGPSTLFDFFISPEDYYLPWILGSFFRLIRIFGVMFSVFATSMYVAITTYHYEVIPKDLLGPLMFSRQNVPFPPFFEVLFLEITIEFLREAGARLPTKIGQTLGIVGGIVIGQAAVQAALTSNILLILVALSALASFTTPIYKMSNAIRFLRFPIIFLSAIWGGIGIFIGVGFLFVHIIRLKSLGSPYVVPIFPLRIAELKDSFIRSSFQILNKRPQHLRPKSSVKYLPNKPVKQKNDLDEE
ncbi:spore germination protein [Paenibacillus sacheonensis]|uniref:Spore germination protein n=1 Tax=Paenibacillus sacheonensis TaxID=742054 RepID=A0A7X4YLJ2_9BACL|nr:spore germination protein [Paenibacillus sacheonensis]MBM7563986.1 tetrahydromethanopterin S-methyltransferase subunit G [Paenibacillus sacheonensis]NBC67674.1 spore germination protein [Paenibacillus sacheonensis]